MANVTVQLGDKRLTEAHNLVVRTALRIEIRATLTTTHWEGCERVLECLLEGKELHNREVYRCMEADTTLVWAECAIHLNTETTINLNLTTVVQPRYTEHNYTLRLCDALQYFELLQSRVCNDIWSQRLSHLTNCLVELGLIWVLGDNLCHKILNPLLFSIFHN